MILSVFVLWEINFSLLLGEKTQDNMHAVEDG